MSLINHRRRSAKWHGASQKVGQSAAPLFLDRIDIHCEIQAVPFAQLSQMAPGESCETIRARVIALIAVGFIKSIAVQKDIVLHLHVFPCSSLVGIENHRRMNGVAFHIP